MRAQHDILAAPRRPFREFPGLGDVGTFEERFVDLDLETQMCGEGRHGLLASCGGAGDDSPDGSAVEELDEPLGLIVAIVVEVALDVERVGVVSGSGRSVANEVDGHAGERYSRSGDPASCSLAAYSSAMGQMLLRDLCGVRSGDKGDISDLSLFADSPEAYEVIRSEVTPERVAEHFGDLVKGTVTRFEVPNLWALKFVMTDALGGGGPASLRADNLGKTLGGALLRLSIDVPDEVAASAPRNGRRPPPAS